MTRNLKNLDSLSVKELHDYYNCYSHHHFKRHDCCIEPKKYKPWRCVHKFQLDDHFCNCPEKSKHDENIKKFDSIILCEQIRPSYTSKEDQINDVRKMIHDMKKSKFLLKSALKDIDNLIEKKKSDEDDLDEVERFYRSNKFIGSELNISSYKDKLPRSDIKAAKYIYELCELNELPITGNPIFSFKKNPDFSSSLQVIACKDK